MNDYKYLGFDFDYPRYVVKGEPSHVFEYSKTAWDLADTVGGDVVELYSTSLYNIQFASLEDCTFIGYGVLSDNELI